MRFSIQSYIFQRGKKNILLTLICNLFTHASTSSSPQNFAPRGHYRVILPRAHSSDNIGASVIICTGKLTPWNCGKSHPCEQEAVHKNWTKDYIYTDHQQSFRHVSKKLTSTHHKNYTSYETYMHPKEQTSHREMWWKPAHKQ